MFKFTDINNLGYKVITIKGTTNVQSKSITYPAIKHVVVMNNLKFELYKNFYLLRSEGIVQYISTVPNKYLIIDHNFDNDVTVLVTLDTGEVVYPSKIYAVSSNRVKVEFTAPFKANCIVRPTK